MDSLLNRELPLEQLMPLIRELLAEGKSVTFSPKGTSMLPMLRQGRDTVTVSPVTGELKKYDLPFYQRDNGAYILHRIVKTGETYTCIGDNQFEYEPGIRQDQIIAVVTGFNRKGKQISVTDAGYRLYCRLWHWSRVLRKYPTKAKYFIRRRMKSKSHK